MIAARQTSETPADGPTTSLGSCIPSLGSLENVYCPGDNHDRQQEAGRRLDDHEQLHPVAQRHRVSRAERCRIRVREEEVVDEIWLPTAAGAFRHRLLGKEKV